MKNDSAGTVRFKIISNIRPKGDLDVFYNLVSHYLDDAVTGNNLKQPTPLTFSTSAPFETTPFSFTIDDDGVAEANQYMVLTLVDEDPSNVNYAVTTEEGASARILMVDDDAEDAANITLSIMGPSDPIFESSPPVFKIIASQNPTRPLTVRYTPTNDGGDFLVPVEQGASAVRERLIAFEPYLDDDGVAIDAENDGTPNYVVVPDYVADLPISILDDTVGEKRGTITITLENEEGPATYTLPATAPSATATIIDDDAPEIYVSNGGLEHIGTEVDGKEPGYVSFPITANISPTKTLNIEFTPTSTANLGTPDYLEVDEQGIRRTAQGDASVFVPSPAVVFGSNEKVANLAVRIQADDLVERDGTIENPDLGSITIELHDEADTANNPAGIAYSIVDNSDGTKTGVTPVKDNDIAKITIASLDPIVEGDSGNTVANFPVTIDKISEVPITVNYAVSIEDGDSADLTDDFGQTSGTVTFNFPSTAETALVQISGDDEVENNRLDETFTVNLLDIPVPPPNMPTSPAPYDDAEIAVASVKAAIENDDTPGNVPEVSIVANMDSVVEGETISFNIESFNLDLGAVDLDISVVQNGNFLLWRASRSINNFNEALTVLEIKTHNDHIDEPNGSVTVTINPRADVYVPVPGLNSATCND